jgi:hypothetical protein
MPDEREPDVRTVAVEHPRPGPDDGLGLLEVAEPLDRLARHDRHRHRVREHLNEPGVRLLQHDPDSERVRRLDAVDRAEHVGTRVALHGEKALDRVLDVPRRELAPVHRRLRMPPHAAAQVEDVRRLIRLRPRFGEVALDRKCPRHDRRPRLVTDETAVREAQRNLDTIRGGQHRIEHRRIPAAYRQCAAALWRLRQRARRREHGAGETETSEREDVTTGPCHVLLLYAR